jgi:putative acetyltransferase
MVANTFQIRPARPGDCDAIFRTHRDSVERLCAAHYSPAQLAMWMAGRSPAMYREAIERGALWVAGDDGMAGFVENDGDELSKLFVSGACAGRGVGAALLAVSLDAIFAGAAMARLEATRNALPFYQKHGFVVTGEGYFSRGNSPVRIEIVKMELAAPVPKYQLQTPSLPL